MFKMNFNMSQLRTNGPIQQSRSLGMGNSTVRTLPTMTMVIPGPNGVVRGCGSCGK